jgi:hypothetical protein
LVPICRTASPLSLRVGDGESGLEQLDPGRDALAQAPLGVRLDVGLVQDQARQLGAEDPLAVAPGEPGDVVVAVEEIDDVDRQLRQPAQGTQLVQAQIRRVRVRGAGELDQA